MSYVIAAFGFAALVILHEAGHFFTAKAVGMRAERFSLFFPPHIFKFKRGETEYCIGVIPLGGYVKITGMNPREEIPAEIKPRSYYSQPIWKRVAVISAGPLVNLVLAFVLLFGLYAIQGEQHDQAIPQVAAVTSAPARGALLPGDRIVAVDGITATPDNIVALHNAIASHHCAGTPTAGCRATTPARIIVQRSGRPQSITLYPVYDTSVSPPTTRVGFQFDDHLYVTPVSVSHAASLSVTRMWDVTTGTVSAIAKIFQPKERSQLNGAVGIYSATQQAIKYDAYTAITLFALISLALALFNMFPFLPLDGGHIFWALAEKVRGRPAPVSVMEGASVAGIAVVLILGVIGLSNDIHVLNNGGFGIQHH